MFADEKPKAAPTKFDFAHLADAIIREQEEEKRESPKLSEVSRAVDAEDDVTATQRVAGIPAHHVMRQRYSAFR